MATYLGDENDEVYKGTQYSDSIFGFGGNDKLAGGLGDDSHDYPQVGKI